MLSSYVLYPEHPKYRATQLHKIAKWSQKGYCILLPVRYCEIDASLVTFSFVPVAICLHKCGWVRVNVSWFQSCYMIN